MKAREIIFLGAGASATEGAPLQGQLFKEYFEWHRKTHNRSVYQHRLEDFFKNVFGIGMQSNRTDVFPTFEDVLGIIELALQRGESLKGYSMNPSSPQLQQLREDMIFLIALILQEKLGGENKYHKLLANRLKTNQMIRKTVFISLNYDILIDNALIELYPDFHVDYGIEFTNFKKKRDWQKPKGNKSVLLLKLHGSLNWLYCTTCITMTLTPKQKRVAKLVFKPEFCESCGDVMVPIIVPPSYYKMMSNDYLGRIWRIAEKKLMECDTIIFCGYSFPDADIHIKYLIKRSEVYRGSTPDIIVINNHSQKSDYEREIEKIRYNRFFRNSSRVHYTTQSFEDFCANGVR